MNTMDRRKATTWKPSDIIFEQQLSKPDEDGLPSLEALQRQRKARQATEQRRLAELRAEIKKMGLKEANDETDDLRSNSAGTRRKRKRD